MTKPNSSEVFAAIRIAVYDAIAEVGIEGVKQMSMFPSASKARVTRKIAA